MALSPRTRLGPYEVIDQIGIGGMGEVYRATDTNLGRHVAIKVLPDALASDAERLARFDREARTLAALNHPNIAAIYGVEKSGGTTALVMELVEGPTLADRIVGAPALELPETLRIAQQIALALEAAHEQGIVHRDLKPANIKLRPDGTVKVLDFGLAKAVEPAVAVSPGVTVSPTITTPAMTQAGLILGTAAYMSPEQAKGRPADKRSDIWSFGAVLYEMLSGARVFDGDGVSDTMAAVLRSEPDWARIPANLPRAVDALLKRCLQKDPRRRLQDISAARFVLEELALVEAPVPQRGEATSRGSRGAMLAALAVAVASLTSAVWWNLTRREPPPEMRLEISTPPTRDVSLALSPDGQQIVFSALTDGQSHLWLRSLNGTTTRMLPGTGGSGLRLPFWSPDGRSVGFFSDGRLRRVDIDTGAVQSLASVGAVYGGGTWNADDVILFAPTAVSPLFRIPASGGEAKQVTQTESTQVGHTNPQFLPDGHHFLYMVASTPSNAGIYIGDLDATGSQRLLAGVVPTYAPPRQLLFLRGTVLFAQDFDPSSLQVSGDPVPIAEGFVTNVSISAATTGTIAYRTGTQGFASERWFVWFDRTGREVAAVGEGQATGSSPSLSPDGRRLAIDAVGPDGTFNIWALETDRGVRSRVTFNPPPASDLAPVWSPDGNSVAYSSNVKGNFDIYRKSLRGQGSEALLLATRELKVPWDWSSDGRVLLYFVQDPKTGADIMGLPLQGGEPFEVVRTSADESAAQFSPDAKWIAYRSNKSGRSEVYVQPFPLGQGFERLISSAGGAQPRWSPDGKELFYVALDEQLMVASITPAQDGRSVTSGTPVRLFRTRIGGAMQGIADQQYVVSRDGRRFLMATLPEEPEARPITLILNRRNTKN